MSESENAVSRRTMLKGAAWALPAVAVASTVPLAAASENPKVVGELVESSANIGTQSSNMSSIFLDPDPENIQSFRNVTITITVTYDQAVDPSSIFTLANTALISVPAGDWIEVSRSDTVYVYKSKVIPELTSTQGVGQAVLYFNVPFDPFDPTGNWAPINSITYTGIAVGDDGYEATPLVAAQGSLVGPTSW